MTLVYRNTRVATANGGCFQLDRRNLRADNSCYQIEQLPDNSGARSGKIGKSAGNTAPTTLLDQKRYSAVEFGSQMRLLLFT